MNNWTSSHFVSIKALLGFRFLVLLWTVFHFIFNFVVTDSPQFELTYMTHMSWAGLLLYFAFATFNSFLAVKEKEPKFIFIVNALYCCAVTIPWIVTITYWALLSQNFFTGKYDRDQYFLQFSEHALNFVIMIAEIFLSKNPLNVFGFLWPMSAVILYTAFSAILRYTIDRPYPYNFMKLLLEGPVWLIVVGILGLMVVCALFYFASFGLTKLRDRIGHKKQAKKTGVETVQV